MRVARIALGYAVSITVLLAAIPAGVMGGGYLLEDNLGLWHPRRFDAGGEWVASDPVFLLALALGLWGWFWIIWGWWFLLRRGRGHPTEAFGVEVSPVTQQLVTGGPYRHTRNPMAFGYLGALLALAGLCGSPAMLLPVAVVGVVWWLQVVYFEEPRLERRFGEPYREYRRRVPRFLPLGRRA